MSNTRLARKGGRAGEKGAVEKTVGHDGTGYGACKPMGDNGRPRR